LPVHYRNCQESVDRVEKILRTPTPAKRRTAKRASINGPASAPGIETAIAHRLSEKCSLEKARLTSNVVSGFCLSSFFEEFAKFLPEIFDAFLKNF
jgi:hypothetical protein